VPERRRLGQQGDKHTPLIKIKAAICFMAENRQGLDTALVPFQEPFRVHYHFSRGKKAENTVARNGRR
jgi:hypothetical protein